MHTAVCCRIRLQSRTARLPAALPARSRATARALNGARVASRRIPPPAPRAGPPLGRCLARTSHTYTAMTGRVVLLLLAGALVAASADRSLLAARDAHHKELLASKVRGEPVATRLAAHLGLPGPVSLTNPAAHLSTGLPARGVRSLDGAARQGLRQRPEGAHQWGAGRCGGLRTRQRAKKRCTTPEHASSRPRPSRAASPTGCPTWSSRSSTTPAPAATGCAPGSRARLCAPAARSAPPPPR